MLLEVALLVLFFADEEVEDVALFCVEELLFFVAELVGRVVVLLFDDEVELLPALLTLLLCLEALLLVFLETLLPVVRDVALVVVFCFVAVLLNVDVGREEEEEDEEGSTEEVRPEFEPLLPGPAELFFPTLPC